MTFNNKYRELGSKKEILDELLDMDIDVFEPETRQEELMSQLFEEFSTFVLHDEKERCLQILQQDNGNSVGELQGGSESFSIYRVSFPPTTANDIDNVDSDSHNNINRKYNNNAAIQLINEFNNRSSSHRRNGKSILTIQSIQQYMLRMCERRSQRLQQEYSHSQLKYVGLENGMFILQFGGPTKGQVRHIDNMMPNVQICLYMSSNCPSTIVYAMEENDYYETGEGDHYHQYGSKCNHIVNSKILLKHWENQYSNCEKGARVGVPKIIQDIMQTKGDYPLKGKWYTKYFAFWKTINSNLHCFGKLYQPVSHQLCLKETAPGTTLLAGGNEVHAGPPTSGPRMFAFSIGIPDLSSNATDNSNNDYEGCDDDVCGGDNDGEVQYSPVTLHIDFCCLLFGLMDYEYMRTTRIGNDLDVREAKCFLLENILLDLIRDYPMTGYIHQIAEDRTFLISWLGRVLDSISFHKNKIDNNDLVINDLIKEAVESDVIFYNPEIVKRRIKRKRRDKK